MWNGASGCGVGRLVVEWGGRYTQHGQFNPNKSEQNKIAAARFHAFSSWVPLRLFASDASWSFRDWCPLFFVIGALSNSCPQAPRAS